MKYLRGHISIGNMAPLDSLISQASYIFKFHLVGLEQSKLKQLQMVYNWVRTLCSLHSQLPVLAFEKVIMRKGIWIAKIFQLVSHYFNYVMQSAISLPMAEVTMEKLFRRWRSPFSIIFLVCHRPLNNIVVPLRLFSFICFY